MTKQEQIEEMAKIIDDRLTEANLWLGSMNKGKGYWIAEKLIEHYQPKLPEDSIVLSREEYDTLHTNLCKYCRENKELRNVISIANEREYRKKFTDEWRKEYHKQGNGHIAGHPDFDLVYKLYFEQKDRIAELEKENEKRNN